MEPVGVEGKEGGGPEPGVANVFGTLPTAAPAPAIAGAWSRVLILSYNSCKR